MQQDLSRDRHQESRFRPLILIADDSPTMRVVTKHALERAGLRTIEAATPLEVIAAAADVPDMFLLDITFASGAQTDTSSAACCAAGPSSARRRSCW
jgi:CheY-like chemotaxis protein